MAPMAKASYFCSMTKVFIEESIAKQLQQNIDTLKLAVNQAQESANNEGKSSAGDKYETGRAMAQNTRDLYAGQLQKAQELLALFSTLQTKAPTEQIALGNIVQTNSAWYYIGIGLGVLSTENGPLVCLSAQAPLAILFLGKKVGESVVVGGKSQEIISVS
jgi:hypothetical protein